MADSIDLNAIVKRIRRTTNEWETTNPILADGVFGIEITEDEKYKLKAGDGETAWNDLEYLSGAGGGGVSLTYDEYVTLYDTNRLDPENIYEVLLTEDQYRGLIDTNRVPAEGSDLTVHFFTDNEDLGSFMPDINGDLCAINLLRNSNFLINQRKKGVYDVDDTYTVDRWKLDCSDDGKAKLSALSTGGVMLESISGSYYGVYQVLENPLNSEQVYAITAEIDGKVVKSNLVGGQYNENGTKFSESEHYFYYILNEKTGCEEIYFRFSSKELKSVTISWVKLETGVVQTSYIAPDPWQELMACGVPDDDNIFGYSKKVVNADTVDGKHASEIVYRDGTTTQAAVGKDGYIAYPDFKMNFTSAYKSIGRLRIKLPVYFSDVMIKFKVSIFDYRGNNSVDYIISGHTENDTRTWENTSATCIGPKASILNNLNVYFSRTDKECYVSIGELNTEWSHPAIKISDVSVSFFSFDYSSWFSGWEIDLVEEDESIIDSVISNTWIGDNINQNLIFNPDFKINQRGLSEYVGVDDYTVDRWIAYTSGGGDRIDVVPDGIKITAKDISKHKPYISQLLEKEYIRDGAYTLSICIDGKVYHNSAVLNDSNRFIFINIPNVSAGLNYIEEKSLYRVYIQTTEKKPSFTINWVKLEPEYYSTAFMTPDYALELIRCRRYFRNETVYLTSVRTNVNTSVVEFYNNIETPMRIRPSITVYGIERGSNQYQINKVRMSNGSVESMLDINKTYTVPLYSYTAYCVGVDVPSTMVATNTFTMQADIVLDAELYL